MFAKILRNHNFDPKTENISCVWVGKQIPELSVKVEVPRGLNLKEIYSIGIGSRGTRDWLIRVIDECQRIAWLPFLDVKISQVLFICR